MVKLNVITKSFILIGFAIVSSVELNAYPPFIIKESGDIAHSLSGVWDGRDSRVNFGDSKTGCLKDFMIRAQDLDDDSVGAGNICGFKLFATDTHIPFVLSNFDAREGTVELNAKSGYENQLEALKGKDVKFDISAFDCGESTKYSARIPAVVSVMEKPVMCKESAGKNAMYVGDMASFSRKETLQPSNKFEEPLPFSGIKKSVPHISNMGKDTKVSDGRLRFQHDTVKAWASPNKPGLIVARLHLASEKPANDSESVAMNSVICKYELTGGEDTDNFVIDANGDILTLKPLPANKIFNFRVTPVDCSGLNGHSTAVTVVSMESASIENDDKTEILARRTTKTGRNTNSPLLGANGHGLPPSTTCKWQDDSIPKEVRVGLKSDDVERNAKVLQGLKFDSEGCGPLEAKCGGEKITASVTLSSPSTSYASQQASTPSACKITATELQYRASTCKAEENKALNAKAEVLVFGENASGYVADSKADLAEEGVQFWSKHSKTEQEMGDDQQNIVCQNVGDSMEKFSVHITPSCHLVISRGLHGVKVASEVSTKDVASWVFPIAQSCDDQWHHFAVRRDMKLGYALFIDGIQSTVTPLLSEGFPQPKTPSPTSSITIGSCVHSKRDHGIFRGQIADVRLAGDITEISCLSSCSAEIRFTTPTDIVPGVSISLGTPISHPAKATIQAPDLSVLTNLLGHMDVHFGRAIGDDVMKAGFSVEVALDISCSPYSDAPLSYIFPNIAIKLNTSPQSNKPASPKPTPTGTFGAKSLPRSAGLRFEDVLQAKAEQVRAVTVQEVVDGTRIMPGLRFKNLVNDGKTITKLSECSISAEPPFHDMTQKFGYSKHLAAENNIEVIADSQEFTAKGVASIDQYQKFFDLLEYRHSKYAEASIAKKLKPTSKGYIEQQLFILSCQVATDDVVPVLTNDVTVKVQIYPNAARPHQAKPQALVHNSGASAKTNGFFGPSGDNRKTLGVVGWGLMALTGFGLVALVGMMVHRRRSPSGAKPYKKSRRGFFSRGEDHGVPMLEQNEGLEWDEGELNIVVNPLLTEASPVRTKREMVVRDASLISHADADTNADEVYDSEYDCEDNGQETGAFMHETNNELYEDTGFPTNEDEYMDDEPQNYAEEEYEEEYEENDVFTREHVNRGSNSGPQMV